MKDSLSFSLAEVENYYRTYFADDLNRYFVIQHKESGVEYITCDERNYDYSSPVVRHKRRLFNLSLVATEQSTEQTTSWQTYYYGEKKELWMFVGILSAIYHSQQHLSRTFSNNIKLSQFFLGINLPLILEAVYNSLNLEQFLKFANCKLYFNSVKAQTQYIPLIQITYPFVTRLVTQELRLWENRVLEQPTGNLTNAVRRFEHDMNEELFMECREHTPNVGLTGTCFTADRFADYFENRYNLQLVHYFSNDNNRFQSIVSKQGYSVILHPSKLKCHRLVDGQPGRTTEENFFFAVSTLMMILAEQSIELYAPEAQTAFHQCSGWPMIYSGPGGGYMVHGLVVLGSAGLLPSRAESFLFLEALDSVTLYFVERFNAIINGKSCFAADSKEVPALAKVLENKNKKLIRRQFVDFIHQCKTIITEKFEKPDQTWKDTITSLYGDFWIQQCSILAQKKSKDRGQLRASEGGNTGKNR